MFSGSRLSGSRGSGSKDLGCWFVGGRGSLRTVTQRIGAFIDQAAGSTTAKHRSSVS